MPKTKLQKQEMLRDLKEKVKKSKSIYFAKFNALGVKENEELRKKLKLENGEYYVAKKTLLDIVLRDKKIEGMNVRDFEGQVATIFGFEDEIAPVKIIDEFKGNNKDKIEFVGGILDNRFYNSAEVSILAKLPSKLELLSKVVGSFNAPISGFVNALAGNLKNLVYVMSAIKDKK